MTAVEPGEPQERTESVAEPRHPGNPPWWPGRGGRPPWWPEGEPWPPHGDWRGIRGGFMRRVGCLLGLLFLLIFVGGGLVSNLLFGWDDRGPPDDRGGPPFGFFGLLLVVVLVTVVVRTVRRTAAPIGAVMEAAGRVAAGDYAARVDARGGGDVGRLVDSFNEMAARLQANEAQRRNLLADVAHELRTPLSVIRGTVEGMLDGVYPRDDAHLAPVLDGTEVMARLLEDLRTLSLAETGALRLHREPTGAAELVGEAVAAAAARAEETGVALTCAVGPLPELDVDPVRVRQVLDNLLANAVRHTPRGGTVRLEAGPDAAGVAFAVTDTGAGIPPDALPHVFDRFWKSADSGGSGLGLAIAKSLVEAHGGAIHAASAPARGTTIWFTLPLS